MQTPSNQQKPMGMTPPHGQPTNPFMAPQGPVQTNSMCLHPTQLQIQMQSIGHYNVPSSAMCLRAHTPQQQQPPPHPPCVSGKPGGTGGNLKPQPTSGTLTNTHMPFPPTQMSNTNPGPGAHTPQQQQPPPPHLPCVSGNPGGTGGNLQPQPTSGALTNTHMPFPLSQMSNTNTAPSANATMASSAVHSPAPGKVPSNQMVTLGIPVTNSTVGPGQLPNFHAQFQPNSLQNPTLEPGPNNQMPCLGIPVPNLTVGHGQLPNLHPQLQPNSPQMSNNSNIPLVPQQYIMLPQLLAAAAAMNDPAFMQAFRYFQSCQNGSSNHQIFPPQSSSPSLPSQTNSSSSSAPPLPPYPPPRDSMIAMKNPHAPTGIFSNTAAAYSNNGGAVEYTQNQAQTPNQHFFSQHVHRPTHFASPPIPPAQRPLLSSNISFPSPLEQSVQSFNPLLFMGQNSGEMSQMANTHLVGNLSFQVGRSIPFQQNCQQLQQGQQNTQPTRLQTSEGASNQQDCTIKDSHAANNKQQYHNGACDRGHASSTGGGRWSAQNGRSVEAGEPTQMIESSGINFSKQANGRAKNGSPLAHFSPTKAFNNGPSQFQKNARGGARYMQQRGGTRSQAAPLICKDHHRSFNNGVPKESHFKSHVKCNEENSSFEASGEMPHEHKLIHHGKDSVQRATALKPIESAEGIQQWIDERKRNYPTEANLKQKAQQMNERRARGELIDEDAKKRQQRMREILSKQRELGLPEAEVPDHYKDDGWSNKKGYDKSQVRGNDKFFKPNRSNNLFTKIPRIKDLTSPRSVLKHSSNFKMNQSGEASQDAIKTKDTAIQNMEGKKFEKRQNICKFFKWGHCKRGRHCKNLHAQQSNDSCKKTAQATELPKRKPTLLEKLLSREIKKEKSHLLQVFRFMVNNSFFTEWPDKPLKYFQWSGEVSKVDPEQAEIQYLSYLSSLCSTGERDAELDDVDATKRVDICETESSRDDEEVVLDEVIGIKNGAIGGTKSSRGDVFEADFNEVDPTDKVVTSEMESRRGDDLEEGEIEEGEIV